MTNDNEGIGKRSTTEYQYVGFRTVPDDLEKSLEKCGCEPKKFKKGNTWREKGKRYTCIEPNIYVSLLYQQGEEISPNSMPSKDEGNIAALVKINISTGIIACIPDQPTIDARNALVTFLLDTYRDSAGAFFYSPNSNAKRETA